MDQTKVVLAVQDYDHWLAPMSTCFLPHYLHSFQQARVVIQQLQLGEVLDEILQGYSTL
jgi:hypothetical protein